LFLFRAPTLLRAPNKLKKFANFNLKLRDDISVISIDEKEVRRLLSIGMIT